VATHGCALDLDARSQSRDRGWFDLAMRDALSARTIRLTSANDDEIEGYLARPADDWPRGGVVVIHHMPGYDRATKEITRRFAELGYDGLCPNLHWREAPGSSPDDAAAAVRAAGGVPDERLVADTSGAASYLRGLPTSNGKVGVIGYCSGGRQAVLAACSLPLDAAVDCYGALVTGEPPPGFPLKVSNLEDKLRDLRCPLLGLFGVEDKSPSPENVARLEQILTELGKTFELQSYEGAGHGFFASDRPSYRVAAAVDGWERVAAFFGRYLS
jgi:carboxymethylenebutenolidase